MRKYESAVSLTDHRPCFLLPRQMHKHPIKRQLQTTYVVAVGWELKNSKGCDYIRSKAIFRELICFDRPLMDE